MSPPHRASASGAILVILVGLVSSIPVITSAEDESPLQPGDYATYEFGDCGPAAFLYSPFFGIYRQIVLEVCPVTLRWDVLNESGDVAEVRIGMQGWRKDRIHFEGAYDGAVALLVNATLNAEHVVRVNRTTMNVTTLNGTYVGRWSFHLTTAEVARGEAELTRNWYNQTVIRGNVTVTNDPPDTIEDAIQRELGVDTYAWADTGWIEPLPEGIERYLPSASPAWERLPPSAPFHDARSLLLLVCFGMFYSDLMFNLYGILWQMNAVKVWPDAPLSVLTLAETNVIQLPGAPPPDDGTDGDATIQPFPWMTAAVFVIVAVAVAFVALQRFLPPAGKKRKSREAGESRQVPPPRRAP